MKIPRWQNQQFLVGTPFCLPRCGSKEYKKYISYKTGVFISEWKNVIVYEGWNKAGQVGALKVNYKDKIG